MTTYRSKGANGGITPAQSRYIQTLAAQLGYDARSTADGGLWADYGQIEYTPWGNKLIVPSKTRASEIIADLKARIGGVA